MALANILPSTKPQEITINSITYSAILSSVRVRSNIGQLDATTFASEDVGDFIPGTERLTLDFGGLVKVGSTAATPFLPLSSFQSKTFTILFMTGATIAGTLNMAESELGAVVGNLRTLTARAFSISTFTVTWPTS